MIKRSAFEIILACATEISSSHDFVHRVGQSRLRARQARGGFSLIEVVIALAVLSVSLLVIFGMMGVGMTTFHQAKAVTSSAQIAQQVISELQNIQFNNLVSQIPQGATRSQAAQLAQVEYADQYTDGINRVNILYFDDQGNELGTNAGGGTPPTGTIYWVNVRIMFPSPMLPDTAANATPPYLNVDLATVLIQVAYNPAGLPPIADANYNWTGKITTSAAILQIANFQAFITRNS